MLGYIVVKQRSGKIMIGCRRKIDPFRKVHARIDVQILVDVREEAAKGWIVVEVICKGHENWLGLLRVCANRPARTGRVG